MDYDDLTLLQRHHPAWRLLRADNAPLVLGFLGPVFVEDNTRSLPAVELESRLDDELYGLNAGAGATDDPPYPRSARAYLDEWCGPEHGWLRRFYPPDSDDPYVEATPALESAYAWVRGLRGREFVGTESRLHTVVDLLRQMVYGAETDPEARLTELHRRRAILDGEIAAAERGEVDVLDDTALRDRYQQFAATARELLKDFREVESNFRSLDRQVRERIAGWSGSKGDLIGEVVGDRALIADSDQGRNFAAFYDFLLSRQRRDELAGLLDRVHDLDTLGDTDARLRSVHHDWLEAAERCQQTVRLLSEQLRRFLDDQVWLENRRVMDLLRGIESHALQVRNRRRPPVAMDLDAFSPSVVLPMERPMYAPKSTVALDTSGMVEADGNLDTDALFEQVYVDPARLADTVRGELRHRDHVSLQELVRTHQPELGLAEVVGYLALAEEDFEPVVDESAVEQVEYVDGSGTRRIVTMGRVTFTHRRAAEREPAR